MDLDTTAKMTLIGFVETLVEITSAKSESEYVSSFPPSPSKFDDNVRTVLRKISRGKTEIARKCLESREDEKKFNILPKARGKSIFFFIGEGFSMLIFPKKWQFA